MLRSGVVPRVDPKALSAYVHLPFCRRKCWYCDFPVVALGSSEASRPPEEPSPHIANYVNVLRQEMLAYRGGDRGDRSGRAPCSPLKTVFFGGGTPSLTPPSQLERVLETIDEVFGIAPDCEISIEADPGTFDRQKLRDFTSLGVTRVSMGVQSFDQRLLELCGRSHSVRDVYQAIEDMHAVGPGSWSLDLMFGLPHQTLDIWHASLSEAMKADPDHVSCYDLQIETGTPFAKWYEVGEAPLPEESLGADFFTAASQRLRAAGYRHYELSNYAKDGHESRHNLTYWHNEPFYAFGLGSTSYIHGARTKRPKKLREYFEWVEGGQPGISAPAADPDRTAMDAQRESREDLLLDTIMLSLRLSEGLRVRGLDETFGIPDVERKIWRAVEDYVARGLVVVAGDRISLSDPEGLLLSNTIISAIFAALDED